MPFSLAPIFLSILWGQVQLTFLTPNGHIGANLQQLASALRLSTAKVRLRLERLLALRWLGQPLVVFHRTESGLETFVLAPGFIPVVEEPEQAPVQPVLRAAPREAVIEHSRRNYSRPRAEVERQIADLNGWDLPEIQVAGQIELPAPELTGVELPGTELPGTELPQSQLPMQDGISVQDRRLVQDTDTAIGSPLSPESQQVLVRRRLLKVGVLPEQADELLAQFDLVRIQRQLMWLPYRAVRNRAGFLLAAIKDDYAAPASLYRPHIESEQPSPQTEAWQRESLPLLTPRDDEY